MKKIIVLIVLLLIATSCSELAQLESGRQQRIKERGRECMYIIRENYKVVII